VDTLYHAVLHGAGMRVRPVMMTAAAIIIGLLPILYGTGTGSEVMSRIAAPMVGGYGERGRADVIGAASGVIFMEKIVIETDVLI